MMVGTIIHARDEGCARDKGCATKAVKGPMDDSGRLASGASGASGAGRPMGDSERLAAYDAFARGIRAELAEVGARMDVLRTENKAKTATYRQLFATRMNLKDIDRRLVERGL